MAIRFVGIRKRSELEQGVETGPKHSHTYYREMKTKKKAD